mgnify:CR=1 FL=1
MCDLDPTDRKLDGVAPEDEFVIAFPESWPWSEGAR